MAPQFVAKRISEEFDAISVGAMQFKIDLSNVVDVHTDYDTDPWSVVITYSNGTQISAECISEWLLPDEEYKELLANLSQQRDDNTLTTDEALAIVQFVFDLPDKVCRYPNISQPLYGLDKMDVVVEKVSGVYYRKIMLRYYETGAVVEITDPSQIFFDVA